MAVSVTECQPVCTSPFSLLIYPALLGPAHFAMICSGHAHLGLAGCQNCWVTFKCFCHNTEIETFLPPFRYIKFLSSLNRQKSGGIVCCNRLFLSFKHTRAAIKLTCLRWYFSGSRPGSEQIARRSGLNDQKCGCIGLCFWSNAVVFLLWATVLT